MAHVVESNQPKCRRCGRRMTLGRRVPVPALGAGSEFRTFECLRCGDTCIEKIAPATSARAMPRPPAGAVVSKKAASGMR
jgi:ribosomal protein L37E